MTDTVVVVSEEAPDVIEVIAPGPQGPQGQQGVKGDVGDVNPAMYTILADTQTARNQAQTAASQAQSSATAASSSETGAQSAQTAAETAKTAAETAQTAAETAKTAAETAQSAAATSATTATTKAGEAATSESNASASAATATTQAGIATTKATEASTSAGNAASSATAALASKNAAATSETNAATSAATATTKATEAGTSANAAAASASAAAASATTAGTKATEAATSASQAAATASTIGTAANTAAAQAAIATTKATDATNAATAAANSATAAASSATTAANWGSAAQSSSATATTKAAEAFTSAANAASSASAAATSANTATTQAGLSAASAVNSANSATAAANSATAAAASATDLATAVTAASNSATEAAGSATEAAEYAQTIIDTYDAAGDLQSSADIAVAAATQAAQSALIASTYSVASGLDTATRNAQAAASLAQGYAASASSVVQQDLSGITAQVLHRSPNAITAMAIYDTSKDSDGGAWTEKCQHTSWYNEPLSGKWLGAHDNEAQARVLGGATLGAELITNGSVSLDTTGWSASNATLQSVDGKLRITGTASGYPSGWQSFTTVVGRAYRVSFTQRTKSGGIFAVNKTDNTNPVGTNRVQLQSNSSNIQVVGYFVATATTSYIHFGLDGINPFTGFWAEYDDISVREVQASNAVPGDYFQLTTDGKFYRLWKNLLNYSQDFDTGNWQRTAISVTANALAAPDGTLTADLLTATGSNAHLLRTAPLGAVAYTFSVYAKRGNSDWFAMSNNGHFAYFNLATGSVGTVGDGSASIQTVGDGWYRCIWVPSDYSWNGAWRVRCAVANGDVNTTNQTAYVWGAQLERGTAATAYEPKAAEGSISEVFRGNKADFPRLAAIVGEATNLTIYDLTEPGRPMWMRFNGHGGSSYPGHPLLNTNQTSIAAVNGNMIVGGNGAWTSWLIVANFIKETSRWYGSSNTGSTHGIWRSNFAQRNTVGQYDLFGSGSENLANNQVNAVAATILPNAPVDPVTGLRNPTIAVATESGLSIITAQNTVSPNIFGYAWPTNGVCIIGTNVYWEWRGNYSSDVGVGSLVGAFPVFILSSDNSIIARGKHNKSSASGLRSAGAYALKYDAQTNVFFNNRTLSLYRHKSGPLASMGASIHPSYNSGWMLSEANGTRRAYLASCISGSIGPTVELFPNADFSSTDVSDWTKSSAAISIAVSNGGLDFTFTANSQFIFKHIPVTPGKAYRVYLQANSFSLAPAISQTDTMGGSVDTNFTGANWSNGSGNNSAYYGVEVVPTKPFLLVGYASAGPSTFRVTSISVREVDFDRSPRANAGPVVCAINGTLTKSQVATGTSLVGYSGFSAANYLREAYSADLDFGTGEWSCSAWLNTTFAAAGNLTLNSNTFSSWNGGNGFTRQNDLITAPDGNQYANKFLCTNTATAEDGGVMYRSAANPAGTSVSFFVQDIGVGKRIFFYDNSSPNAFFSYFDFSTKTFTNSGQAIVTSYDELPNNWYRLKYYLPQGNANYLKIKYEGLAVGDALHLFGHQVERTIAPTSYKPSGASQLILTVPIADRSFGSGPSLTIGMNSEGKLTATSFDGTTTRSVTTTASYNSATWLKAEACYTTDGTLSIRVNGREVATSRGNPLLSLNSRYNLLTYSQQFSDSGWAIIAGFSSKVSTAVLDPLGGTTACEIGYLNANGSLSKQSINASMVSGQQYTFSIWARRDSGSNQLTFGSNTGIVLGNFTPTSTWQRYSVTFTYNGTWAHIMLGDPNASGWTNVQYWGAQLEAGATARTYQRTTTVAETEVAPLTIGNNFAADAPFPGSIALLKLGATVPTYEQSQFMYEQEKQLFRAGAQSVLPDSGSIVDMAYDDATDRWVAVSASNESYWTGLVRNSVTPVPAGSYTRVVAGSGLELVARSTTNPGVDVTIPAYGLREELVKRAEAAARLTKEIVTYDYVGGFTANITNGSTSVTVVGAGITYPASYIGARISGAGIPANTTIVAVSGNILYLSAAATATTGGVSLTFLDFELPAGMEAKTVMVAGSVKQEGSTKDYTRLYDGFIETIRFAVAPGATAWVQIQAQRITLQ